MQVTREDLNPCTVKLDVVCTPDVVKEGFARAIKFFAKRVRVPGFRPGSAPRHLVEPTITQEQLAHQAADEILKQTVQKIVKEQDLKPYQAPKIRVTKVSEDPAECEFSMKVPLAPIVELGEYKGVPAESPSIEVTDEEVEYHLEEMRKSKGKRVAVTDRGAQEGDNAVVSIAIDGDETGGEGRKFMVTIGKTFPALDEALTGMRAEEMKSVEIAFPEAFHEKDWAGKTLSCLLILRTLNAVSAPALDDQFAQTLSGDASGFKSENLDELKTKLREAIGHAKSQALAEYIDDQIFDHIVSHSKLEVPDTMWEDVAEQRLADLVQECTQRGETFEDYCKSNGMTVEEMVEKYKTIAKAQVLKGLVVRQIANVEKMKLSNQDLNAALFAMAQEYEMEPREMLEALKKNRALAQLEFQALYRKVTTYLREKADLRELAPTS